MKRVLAVLLLCCSCGPHAGDSCSPPGSGQCDGDKLFLVCEDGKLDEYYCSGAGGCRSTTNTTNTTTAHCDFSSGVKAGDLCPHSIAQTGFCDGKDLVTCVPHDSDGPIWQRVTCPNSCADSGSTVGCR